MFDKPITQMEALIQVTAKMTGPMPFEEMARQIQELAPSKAKNYLSALRSSLRNSSEPSKWVTLLDKDTVAPIRWIMNGLRFRLPLSRREVERGILLIYPGFEYYYQLRLPYDQLCLFDQHGTPLTAPLITLKEKRTYLDTTHTLETPSLNVSKWFQSHKVHRDDVLLITVKDWEHGHFSLELETQQKAHRAEIERKNQELADRLFEILENEKDENVNLYRVLYRAFARLSDPRGYPGDHWMTVIEQDPRMKTDGMHLSYPEHRTWIKSLMADPAEEKSNFPSSAIPPEQKQQVYQFKVVASWLNRIWRRIEIQGGQTLKDFDKILREAFHHDYFDHLGGFWKRVPRGTGKQVRRLELGRVAPFGEGRNTDLKIAGLELKPGEQLEYVYDLGDWYEHILTLEAVKEPEAGIQYPRITDQNKPRYEYCESCRAAGRETIAKWICIDCSQEQNREVLVCEECAEREHEEHDREEILY